MTVPDKVIKYVFNKIKLLLDTDSLACLDNIWRGMIGVEGQRLELGHR